MGRQYWALQAPGEIGGTLLEKAKNYMDFLRKGGYWERASKAYAMYAGYSTNNTSATSSRITSGGEQGELLHTVENHFANIVDHNVNTMTATRPNAQFFAGNSNSTTLSSASIANLIGEHYLTDKGLEDIYRLMAKRAWLESECFLYMPWNFDIGDIDQEMPINPETGKPNRLGDIEYHLCGISDVVRDFHAPDFATLKWGMFRTWQHRYVLASAYPEHYDAICSVEPSEDQKDFLRANPQNKYRDETDYIPVWDFYHYPCDISGLEAGKYVRVLSENIVIPMGPYPYGDKAVGVRLTAGEKADSCMSKTPAWDMLGLQDQINAMDSAMVTLQLNRGIGNLLAPVGANVGNAKLGDSMQVITYAGEKPPQPLQWPDTPPGMFGMKREKVSTIETIGRTNSVVRGNPSDNIGADASGAKLAMFPALAVQANNDFEKFYANTVRDSMMLHMHRLVAFGGKGQRLAKMVGKNNEYQVKKFKASELEGIEYVRVDIGNPATRTIQGKMMLAKDAVQMGACKSFDQYLELITNGTWDPMFEGSLNNQRYIRSENERMMAGIRCQVLWTDPWWQHIPGHLEALNNPGLREQTPENELAKTIIFDHLQEHLRDMRNPNPSIVIATGGVEAYEKWQAMQQAMIQMAQLGIQMPGEPLPQIPGAPMPPPPPGSGPMMPENIVASPEGAQMARLPGMPRNPVTGDKLTVTEGGNIQ